MRLREERCAIGEEGHFIAGREEDELERLADRGLVLDHEDLLAWPPSHVRAIPFATPLVLHRPNPAP